MIINLTKEIQVGQVKVVATYPNVGGKLEIESLKLLFSNNLYGDIARSFHISGNQMLNVIDAYAYLLVCCPDLQLKVDGFQKLDGQTEVNLVSAYKKHFQPWYANIEKELYSVDVTEEKEPDEENAD